MAVARARGARPAPGPARWAGAALAAVVILALTFALGVLVGRQWARPAASGGAAEAQKRPASAGRRSGLVEGEAERGREAPEKLTFYQTLTAPLGPAPSYAKPNAGRAAAGGEASGPGRGASGSEPGRAAAGGEGSGPGRGASGSEPGRAAAAEGEGSGPGRGASGVTSMPQAPPVAASGWNVQVGVFKSRPQAEAVQGRLRESGLDAYVTTQGTADGDTRFRVRVGPFGSRADADRVADRVRGERSLPTYVTNN